MDRSGADAKSEALARSIDEANRAAAGATNKIMAVNREAYRQQNEAREVAEGADEKKGHFSSL